MVRMFWTVLLICAIGAKAQKNSPCPDIFRYEAKGDKVLGQWTGVITLSTEDELQGIWLHVTLDEPADLLLNWFGDATSQDNKEFTIRNPSYRLEAGPPVLVKLQVQYNAAVVPPSLTKIRFNGRTICGSGSFIRTTTTGRPIISQKGTKATTGPADVFKTKPTPRRTATSSTTATSVTQSGDNEEETNSEFFSGDLNILITEKKPGKPQSVLTNTIQCGTVAKRGTPLITNGKPAKEGDWPWHIALYTSAGLELRYICGGSLIGKRHVITAAHCVTRPQTNMPSDPDGFLIHLGRTNLRKFGKGTAERGVDTISVYPGYNSSFFQEDLAVLKLSDDVNFTDNVRPVCLWSKGISTTVTGMLGTVVGWGYDQSHKISETLQETRMPVVDTLTCIYSKPDFFNKYTTRTTYCAGFRNGTSVCNGDSGGGMFFAKDENAEDKVWEIRGLVSVSLALQRIYCDPYNYVIFTDLAYYIDWIKARLAE